VTLVGQARSIDYISRWRTDISAHLETLAWNLAPYRCSSGDSRTEWHRRCYPGQRQTKLTFILHQPTRRQLTSEILSQHSCIGMHVEQSLTANSIKISRQKIIRLISHKLFRIFYTYIYTDTNTFLLARLYLL